MAKQVKIDSGPICFGANADLFGWLHVPKERRDRPAIVICNPVGFEFIRAFRSIRHLANQLAAEGYFVLRFDYHSTGDSAGDEFDSGRLGNILRSIGEAVETIGRITSDERVTLIGLRFGATLAGRIAEERKFEQIILWAPCESGGIYVREQQIMASAQSKSLAATADAAPQLDGIDAGGFFLTRDTQAELGALDLGARPFHSSPPILLLNRDDVRTSPSLEQKLRASGSSVEVVESTDFKSMMLPPQFSSVPEAAINSVCDWLESRNQSNLSVPVHAGSTIGSALHLAGGVIERMLQFGPDDRLFGILSMRKSVETPSGPAVIMLCGGATHRVSANRMYVSIARQLAGSGTPVLRFDLAGLGDSDPHDGYPENKPYTDRLPDDVCDAMEAVEQACGSSQFLLFGLCSGAYAAIQAAKRSDRVTDLVLANQLVYYIDSDQFGRLASGEIPSAHDLDFPRSNSPMYRIVVKLLTRISPHWGRPGEILSRYILGGHLPRDLDDLSARGIRLAFVQSRGDPAVLALQVAANSTVRRLTGAGLAELVVFDGTDHTFSPSASQHALSEWLTRYVSRRSTLSNNRVTTSATKN